MTIFIIITCLVAALLIYAALKPETFRIERSLDINARAGKIFPLINDLSAWPSWSPYEKKDPEVKRTLSGPLNGKGSVYEWEGNKNVGNGRMEIIEAIPPFKVLIKLDFFSPFEAHNTAEFTLTPNGDQATNISWAMYGPSLFISRLITTFCSMEKMVGKDFEQGLINIKNITEKGE